MFCNVFFAFLHCKGIIHLYVFINFNTIHNSQLCIMPWIHFLQFSIVKKTKNTWFWFWLVVIMQRMGLYTCSWFNLYLKDSLLRHTLILSPYVYVWLLSLESISCWILDSPTGWKCLGLERVLVNCFFIFPEIKL